MTGSTNAMAVPQASEALVGRMEIMTLWPLSLREAAGGSGSVCDLLFGDDQLHSVGSARAFDPAAAIVRGGYPEPLGWTARRRDAWYRDYLQTVCQREVRDLSDIATVTAVPRLLTLLASRASGLLNMADVSRAVDVPYATLNRHLALLQAVCLFVPTPRWSNNVGLRTVKSPKIALGDTGLACALLRLDAEGVRAGMLLGPLLENLVAMELRKDAAWSLARPEVYHYRDETGREVDIVLEGPGGQIVGIEVKASASVTARDASGLRFLAERLGARFHRGVILHTGDGVVPFAANIHAVPYGALWESR
ncbi:MAG: ATP-binding protein [Armatimonadetes bacterium]|nr:ATP-binding protein [Armatimonadota bacterium]